MEINTKLNGDLVTMTTKKYKETNVRVANVIFLVKVKEDEAAEKLGEEFARIAFAGMRKDEEGNADFPCKTISGPKLKCGEHEIKILGKKVKVIPEIPEIRADGKEPAVIAKFILPLPCDKTESELIGEIATSSGDVVTIDFNSKQIPLNLPGVKKDKGGVHGNPKPERT